MEVFFQNMELGISTACFYPDTTEDSLDQLIAMNVKNVEIFLNSYHETDREYIQNELLPRVRSADVNVMTLHPFSSMLETSFIFGNYPRRLDEGLELYRRQIEAASILGANTVVLHGVVRQMNISDELFLERYAMLEALADSYGVVIAMENVVRCKSGSLDFIRHIKTRHPNIKFVLDFKQVRREGAELSEFIRAMGASIAHIHISDGGKNGDCIPIGTGDEDFCRAFLQLAEVGFTGSVSVELYRTSYTHTDEVLSSLQRLEQILKGC